MPLYLGVKLVQATPMTAKEFEEKYNRTTSYTAGSSGYLVVYPDGYESWSPRSVFEEAYRLTTGLNFGLAVEAAKTGKKIARAGWNGKGMFVAYSPGTKALPAEGFWSPANREYAESVGGTVEVLPCLTMKTATGEILMGWLASQSDMLADDWQIIE